MKSTAEPEVPLISNEPQKPTSEQSGALPARTAWLWHLLSFSPFVVLVWFVAHFGVNVPIADDWPFAHFFHAIRFKTSTFNDFFDLANEHRLLIPKLIWTPLAFATHWNLKAELTLNLILALIVFAVFYRLALHHAERSQNNLLNTANVATSILFFSLIQYDTWLLGIMGAVLMVHALLTLAIGVCFVERLNPWSRFTLASLFCVLASFSMLQGLASWLAMIPCIMWLQKGERNPRKLYIWLLLFAASWAVYSYHFRFAAWTSDLSSEVLAHPLRSAAFFLALLGAPFSLQDAGIPVSTACLLGGVILFAWLGCVFMLRRHPQKEMIAPWLSVGIFGVLYAAMVTVGRSSFGLGVALSLSRYISGALFILISVVQLGRMVFVRKGSQIYTFAIGALCALTMFSSIRAVSVARELKQERSQAKLFLELIRYIDPATDRFKENCLFPLLGPEDRTWSIRIPAEWLNDLGFLHLASGVSFDDHPSPGLGAFESADGTGNLLHLRAKDEVTVSGWALRPAVRGVSKVVLISYGDQKTFLTGTVVGGAGPIDRSALRRDALYLRGVWTASFPAKFLPRGEGILKAWVYDAAQNRFIRLPESGGEKQFKVETP